MDKIVVYLLIVILVLYDGVVVLVYSEEISG